MKIKFGKSKSVLVLILLTFFDKLNKNPLLNMTIITESLLLAGDSPIPARSADTAHSDSDHSKAKSADLAAFSALHHYNSFRQTSSCHLDTRGGGG